MAAKLGGGNLDGNPRLKTAVLDAKSNSVPSDNIERAIKRGTGDIEGVDYEEVTYEGYGPGGVAILIQALTDNKNRTVAEVRHALTRGNGSLGSSNSVAYQFKERGVLTIEKSAIAEDKLFDAALDAGAEDIQDEGEVWEVVAEVQELEPIRQAVEGLGVKFESEIRSIPENFIKVAGKDAQALLKLLDALDDLDDVQRVTANFDIDESEMESLD